MTLRVQLLLVQVLIVCVTTVATGLVAGALQERSIREAYKDRMQAVALSVAQLPAVLDAFDDADPSETIQPIAELIRKASDLTYVVVTDAEGIRYSHPDPDRIGERVSTDPSVPLSGEIYVGTQTGTLGTTWRVKVPIFEGSAIIGTVSVGILESELSADFQGNLFWLVLAMVASAIIGVFGAAAVTAMVRRRIFRLEPRDIASLVENRETTLHRLSEGVISVDRTGTIELVNDAAARLLDKPATDLIGLRAEAVLDPILVDVLENGEPDGRLVLSGERVLVARSTGSRHSGEEVAATLLIRDHTELHALLRRMDGAQSLAAGLRTQAHEFANAMHVVSGLIETGRTGEAREYIARRTPGGSIGLADDATVLGDVELTALLSVKAAQARELGIALEVQQAETPRVAIPTDFGADLLTVIGNLVDNAIEACTLGDRIVVSAGVHDKEVRVSVEDSGPGVPNELRGWIFAEGVSTKAASSTGDRSVPSRGIGLAIVRRVVQRRKGDILVTDSALGGALFTMLLPLPSTRRRSRMAARDTQ
ncbi:MAG: GHKL domain-containing protein [Microbacteriaceae bacterium]|nr:GHKL domain-containing protein [Microbacteriaceae bacterium]